MNIHIISISLHVWIRGLLTYALLTLPSLFFWPMYATSIMLAGIWSLPALLLFVCLLWLLKHSTLQPEKLVPVLLLATICITAGCTWGAAWHFTYGENMAQDYFHFSIFPLAGIVSACLAVLISKKRLIAVQGQSSFTIIHSSISTF